MAIESFEVSKSEEYGDLLNKHSKKEKLTVGVYTSGWYEYYRMYPDTLENFVKSDVEIVVSNLRKYIGEESEIIWPGIISTLDDADNAGKLFKEKNVDLMILILFTYTSDVITLQCLRYVEKTPLIIFLRQSHKDIDFNSNYEQTLRNSAMISLSQITGTFRKMCIFDNFEVVIGADFEAEPYIKIKKYFNALKVYHYLRELNIGIIGHVYRGMFDHEFDRTSITGSIGPQVIDIQISHFLDIWDSINDSEVNNFINEVSWINDFGFRNLGKDEIFKECKFTLAYGKLIKKFRLDAACYLGQHFVEVKTGCTGYLSNIIFAREKKIMTNTEGDINGLIMMCVMNKLTGQSPLFSEWGEFGEKENAMMMMMHGYGDPDLAKSKEYIKITPTPEDWGHTGTGFSMEYTAKPGFVTVGHLIDDKKQGWRMLITKGEALDVEKSIPCEDVTMIFKPQIPIKEFIRKILIMGFDHHAIICYGDFTEELGYLADLMNITKNYI